MRGSETRLSLPVLWSVLLGVLVVCPLPGFGQVFDQERPYEWTAIAGGASLGEATIGVQSCASSGHNVLVGLQDGSLWQLGAVNDVTRKLQLSDFAAAAGGYSLTRILALANTRMLDRVFVGLEGAVGSGKPGGPVVVVEPWGAWPIDVVVTPEEMVDGLPDVADVNVCGLAVEDDESLWAGVLSSSGGQALFKIDRSKPAGERAKLVITSDNLLQHLGGLGSLEPGWPCLLAADTDGHVYFRASQSVTDGTTTEYRTTIYSSDQLGNLSPVTATERADCGSKIQDPAAKAEHCPANSSFRGLVYDDNNDLLLGWGTALFAISPKFPGQARTVVSLGNLKKQEIAWGGPEAANTAEQPGSFGCLTYMAESRFASVFHSAFFVTLKPGALDMDHDGLAASEETGLATDPTKADTDQGGASDLAELLSGTNPLAPEDDQPPPPKPQGWSWSYRYHGSPWRESIQTPAYLAQYGLVTFEGEIQVAHQESKQFYTFADFELPGKTAFAQAVGYRMVPGVDESVLAVLAGPASSDAVRIDKNGQQTPVQSSQAARDMAGGVAPVSVVETPGADLFAGYANGRLLEGDTIPSLVYDAVEDRVNAGLEEDGWCTAECSCTSRITTMVYEPKRSITYFMVETKFICPWARYSEPTLVALTADRQLRRIMGPNELSDATGLHGNITAMVDMEPDQHGGMWLLAAHGDEQIGVRSLTHVDSNFTVDVVASFLSPLQGSDQSPTLLMDAAWDLLVDADGQVFVLAGLEPGNAPGHYLAQLVPMDDKVRAGDIIAVQAAPPVLGKVSASGGGATLIDGFPLKRPMAVAATEHQIVVSDAEFQGVVRFLLEDGVLQEGMVLENIGNLAGLDIDEDENIIAVDMSSNSIIKIKPDGSVETVFKAPELAMPTDIVLVEGGTMMVAASEDDNLVRLGSDGTLSVYLSWNRPWSLAVFSEAYWLATSAAAGEPPMKVLGIGWREELISDRYDFNSGGTPSGGITGTRDGLAVWGAKVGQDRIAAPYSHDSAVFRTDEYGYTECLALGRPQPLGKGDDLDVTVVRGVSDALPIEPEPGIKPVDGAPDAGQDAATTEAEPDICPCDMGSDDTGGHWGDDPPQKKGGGCVAGDAPDCGFGTFLVLVLFLGLLVSRTRRIGLTPTRVTQALVVCLLTLSTSASAQLLRHQYGQMVTAFAGGSLGAKGALGIDVVACASAPNFMLVLGHETGGITAVGPGLLSGPPYEELIATSAQIRAAAGVPVGKLGALATDPLQQTIYVGFIPDYEAEQPGGPILGVSPLTGDITVMVTLDELLAVQPVYPEVKTMTCAPDGTLYARIGQAGDPLSPLVQIDPAKAAGERIRVITTAAEVAEALGVDEQGLVFATSIAVDDKARVYFQVSALEESQRAFAVVVRLDDDGTLTELTNRDFAGSDEVSGAFQYLHPSRGADQALAWDPSTGLLVGMGFGMWVYSTDHPGVSAHLFRRGTFETIARAIQGPGSLPGGPPPYGCLEYLNSQFYGFIHNATAMTVYFDPDFLDLDDDRLPGFEEKRLGTNPEVADSDDGGLSDGAEILDASNPSVSADDRVYPQPPDHISVSGRFWGSQARLSLGDRFRMDAGGLLQQGAVALDGRLLLSAEWSKANAELYAFSGFDSAMEPSGIPSTRADMATLPDGSLVGLQQEGPVQVPVRLSEQGVEVLLTSSEAETLLGEGYLSQHPSAAVVGTDPRGRVWLGYNNGKLLRLDLDDGTKKIIYDSRADLIRDGYMTSDGQCVGCQCWPAFGPMLFEPVRGLMYMWVQVHINCGQGETYMTPTLVAFSQDDTFRFVTDDEQAMEQGLRHFGGVWSIQDMVPDGTGGLWVLSAHSIDRTLVRVDANLHAHEILTHSTPSYTEKISDTNWLSLYVNHADQLLVTPDHRLFAISSGLFMQTGPYFLAELVSLDDRLRPGDLVIAVQEESGMGSEPGVGKALADGGGIRLTSGPPLVKPVTVAASGNMVAVGDEGLGAVAMFPLEDGVPGEPKVAGTFADVGGLDFEQDGSLLVADRSKGTVERLTADGQQETAYDGFQRPSDVLVTADGLVVADAGVGQVILVKPGGAREVLADVPGASSVAVVDGRFLVVASEEKGREPVRIDGSGKQTPLIRDNDYGYNSNPELVSGGVTAGPGGLVFWVSKNGPDPVAAPYHMDSTLLRVDQEGYAQALVYSSSHEQDMARLRPASEPLPRLPKADSIEPGDDASGSNGQDTSGQDCTTRSSGCSAAQSPSFSALVLFFLAAIALVIRRDRRPTGRAILTTFVALLAVLSTTLALLSGCGGSKTECFQADISVQPGADSSTHDSSQQQDQVQPDDPCKGLDLCDPALGSVCEGTKARKRCRFDNNNCPVWGPVVPCPADEMCMEGLCQRDTCYPDCYDRNCGDDGCGGTCGQCPAGFKCCLGQCAQNCSGDCVDRECGSDRVGGTCGECDLGAVCAGYQCKPMNKGSCLDLLACFQRCDSWDYWCFEGCFTSGLETAKPAASGIYSCLGMRCVPQCPDGRPDAAACQEHCLLTDCAPAFASCAATGNDPCTVLHQCMNMCPENDAECSDSCIESASADGAATWLQWKKCMSTWCDFDLTGPQFDACVIANPAEVCSGLFTQCFGACNNSCDGLQCGPNDCGLSCGECLAPSACDGGVCVP